MGSDSIENDKITHARELLLAEHKYLGDSFWKNEESGETRVRFFITLVTAVLAAIGTLLPIAIKKDIYVYIIIPILIFTLFSLLMFGIVTLLRILKRNEATDGYKKGMDEVRKRFKEYFDEYGVLSGYEPFGSSKYNKSGRKIGGLAHIVSVLNSLIFAALTCIIIIGLNLENNIDKYKYIDENIYKILFSLFFVFFVSFFLQCYYAKYRDKRSKEKIRSLRYTHAGGIVWKIVENEPQFLIVTAKSNPSHWVLPKGHIEEGERIEETSVREVREEACVDARVVAIVGSTKYETDKEFVHIKFYLMEYLKEQEHGEHEGRKSKWCTFQEAVTLLTFIDTKQLLRLARYRLEKVLRNKSE